MPKRGVGTVTVVESGDGFSAVGRGIDVLCMDHEKLCRLSNVVIASIVETHEV